MAENWAGIAAEVSEALASVGFTATLRKTTETAGPNEWTPGVPVVTDTAVTILSGNFRLDQIDGTLIQATDRLITMEARTVVPSPGDSLLIGGKDHEVIMVRPLDPGGVAVLYEVQVRG
jgi:hypothetical protein